VILFGGGIVADTLTLADSVGPGSQPSSQPGDSLGAAGSILVMLALPGVYAYHASKAGWLGLIGYVLFQVGWVFVIAFAVVPLMFNDVFKDVLANQANTFAFTLGVALSIGLVLTSIAAIRARVYPVWAGILMLGAAIAFVFSFLFVDRVPARASQISLAVSGLMFGVAWISIGTVIWATTRTE
jgi:hypothetical protein